MNDMLPLLNQFFSKGSLQRFGLAGGFNTLLFLILIEIFYTIFDESSAPFVWAVSWILTSYMAHFIHRWFTFDTTEPIRKTIPLVAILYIFGMLGSTWTYVEFLQILSIDIRLIALLNVLLWGAITWLSMRVLIFKHVKEIKLHMIPTTQEE
jgi:hypothetical protein